MSPRPVGGRVVDMGSVDLVGSSSAVAAPPPAPASPSKRGRVAERAVSLDPRVVAEALSQRRGYAIDPAKVALKMLDADFKPVRDKHRTRVEWEIWDKRTPINGVPAADILGRPEYARADNIYLLRIDGQVAFFQPHLPEAEGFERMDAAGAEWVAAVHAEQIVDLMTFDEIIADLNSDADLVAVPEFAQQLDTEAIAAAVAAALPQLSNGNRPTRRR